MLVSCKLDTRNLMAAQAIFQQYSRQTPAAALNRTVMFVLYGAQKLTPFVTGGEIDSELSVLSTPLLSTRGKTKGQIRKPKKKGGSPPQAVSIGEGGLAQLIVVARLHRYSNYNVLTDQRYALDWASFSPGAGVWGFWAEVSKVAERMVKSRHSSTHFFEASWTAIIKKLKPFVPRAYGGTEISTRKVNPELGDVEPAKPGGTTVMCVISNKIGMDDKFPTINAIRNMEAHRILEPVLQRAINAEYDSKMKLFAQEGWFEKRTALKQLGFTVT